MLPVEVSAAGIKIFDWQKVCLITSLLPSEALDCLIFNMSKVNFAARPILDPLMFIVWRLQGRSQDLLSGEAIPYHARSARRKFC